MSMSPSLSRYPISCFILLHKSRFFSNPIFSRVFRSNRSVNFCSFVEGIDSDYGLKSRTENPPLDRNSGPDVVSYLVNSCGVSVEKANLISKRLNFKTLEQPNAVLAFLREHGFSKIHIQKLVREEPRILKCNSRKTLLPKVEFFRSIWGSSAVLANNLSANHNLLMRSLEKSILPLFTYLKSVFGTDDRIASTTLWRAAYFCKDPLKNLAPNIAVLRELGVRESCVKLLLAHHPMAIMQKNEQFKEVASEVTKMGFDPSKSAFINALHARSGNGNRSRWERCYEVYSSWGLSEDNIRMAYRLHPLCMLISEQKLSRMLDFLVNKMGWDSQMIARYPVVLCYSLEKRIIPRGSVIHLLSLKGLKKDVNLFSAIVKSESNFLGNFVTPYEAQVPQLRDIYQGKMGIPNV